MRFQCREQQIGQRLDRSNNVLPSAVCSRHQYVLTNDHGRQDSIIYHWLNSRALNREPGFIQLTQLIFMQAYFITLHEWHAPAANASKYCSLFCQKWYRIYDDNKTQQGNLQGGGDAKDNIRLDCGFIYPGVKQLRHNKHEKKNYLFKKNTIT